MTDESLSAVEREFRSNLRELRRLELRRSQGMGRNAGATLKAISRRQARDRELLAKLARADVQPCQWFATCERPATTTVAHPVLGDVPTCERCAARVEANR